MCYSGCDYEKHNEGCNKSKNRICPEELQEALLDGEEIELDEDQLIDECYQVQQIYREYIYNKEAA